MVLVLPTRHHRPAGPRWLWERVSADPVPYLAAGGESFFAARTPSPDDKTLNYGYDRFGIFQGAPPDAGPCPNPTLADYGNGPLPTYTRLQWKKGPAPVDHRSAYTDAIAAGYDTRQADFANFQVPDDWANPNNPGDTSARTKWRLRHELRGGTSYFPIDEERFGEIWWWVPQNWHWLTLAARAKTRQLADPALAADASSASVTIAQFPFVSKPGGPVYDTALFYGYPGHEAEFYYKAPLFDDTPQANNQAYFPVGKFLGRWCHCRWEARFTTAADGGYFRSWINGSQVIDIADIDVGRDAQTAGTGYYFLTSGMYASWVRGLVEADFDPAQNGGKEVKIYHTGLRTGPLGVNDPGRPDPAWFA